MNYSSKLLENAVNAFTKLPSIGKKSALRLVLHLLKSDLEITESLIKSLHDLKDGIKECKKCYNLSDDENCHICNEKNRDHTKICVVETIRDVMAIEETGQYRGLYHVLGGVISPLEGIGAEDIKIPELIDRVSDNDTVELIMGISPTIEGDTTIFYISKKLADQNVKITLLSRGVAFGGELEYTDELTLGRSIMARVPYSHSVS